MTALIGHLDVLQKIWEWAKRNLTKEETKNKLLLAADKRGNTVWHVAAERGNLAVIEKLWEWAEENLTKEEIKNKLLLATDRRGKTLWHVAVERGNLAVKRNYGSGLKGT
jgi:endo-1,4-beta-D-glucanase Y